MHPYHVRDAELLAERFEQLGDSMFTREQLMHLTDDGLGGTQFKWLRCGAESEVSVVRRSARVCVHG